MDPTLFNIDWERLFQALSVVIVLAFVLERALSVVFENKYIAPLLEKIHIKELIALVLGFWVVKTFGFDMVSIVLMGDENTTLGYWLTAAIIAGGSKASIKLFVDIWKIGNQIKNGDEPTATEENQEK